MRLFVLVAACVISLAGVAQNEGDVHKLLIVYTYQQVHHRLTLEAKSELTGRPGTIPVQLEINGWLRTESDDQEYPEKLFPNYEEMLAYVELTYCHSGNKPSGKIFFSPLQKRLFPRVYVSEELRDAFPVDQFTIEIRYGKGSRASVFGDMITKRISCYQGPTPLPTIIPDN